MAKQRRTETAGTPTLVRGVTGETFWKQARDFIAGNDDTGFIVARAAGQSDGVEWEASPEQWGAWLSYFLRKRIRVPHSMGALDHMTVPAEWPHEFDAEETIQGDHKAGAAFARLLDPEKRTGFFEPDDDLGFRKMRTGRSDTRPEGERQGTVKEALADRSILNAPEFYPKLFEGFRDEPAILDALHRCDWQRQHELDLLHATQGRAAVLERLAKVGDPSKGPAWLVSPDMNAPWRKEGPPSDELKADMAQHLRRIDKAKAELEARERGMV